MTSRKTNLASPIYHDDDAARSHLESLLWPHGPVCPRCAIGKACNKDSDCRSLLRCLSAGMGLSACALKM